MAVAAGPRPATFGDATAGAAARSPRAMDFVRLKLRLTGNGFRGQPWRVVGFVIGLLFGAGFAAVAALGLTATAAATADVGYVVASFVGAAVVLGWTLVPLLFFGVDETLDPARFALLPLPRSVLARGMLAAAFVGIPAVATALAMSGLVVAAGLRFGPVEAGVAAVGVVSALVLCVVVSRTVTSAFAALLRSRRMRDLAVLVLAVLASSIAPIQWALTAVLSQGTVDETMATALRVAEILGWTPLGGPFVIPYDAGAGEWGLVAARVGLTLATIAVLVWWWSRTIESAMLGTSSGGGVRSRSAAAAGATASLFPGGLRGVRRGPFGAILAREWRSWWRDPRRRASMVSVLIASAVVPLALSLGGTSDVGPGIDAIGLGFTVTLAGSMAGLLLANQFAFDASAHAAHLLAAVPGRVDLRARAAAIGLFAAPVQCAVVVAVTVGFGEARDVPTGLGILAASFGAAVASSSVLSVLVPYAMPESTNPFAMNSGSGSAKGLFAAVAILATLLVSGPVVVAGLLLRSFAVGGWLVGPWIVLVIGLGYGLAAGWIGTGVAGRLLDGRGPEVLVAVTPRR